MAADWFAQLDSTRTFGWFVTVAASLPTGETIFSGV